MAKAKAWGPPWVEPLAALVPALSTPSTGSRSRASGSSAPRGTSHGAQTGRMARFVPLSEEGSGDRDIH